MKDIRRCAGFTLVELLVVVAIIGILLGLMLPAVRRVGPAAKRTQCMNNLRQIALASLNYESAHMKFPSAKGLVDFTGVGSADQYSNFVEILPFIEQGNLYTAITEGKSMEGTAIQPCPLLYGQRLPHWNSPVPPFVCPSLGIPDSDHLPVHYGVCIGDRARNISNPTASRGGHISSKPLNFSDLTDGSSNTIFAGEIGAGEEGNPESPFAINMDESFFKNPAKCFEIVDKTRSGWAFKKGIHLSSIGRGGHWADGRAGIALFGTILPPKSPSVAIRGSVGVDGIYSANGPHPGGINVAFFDGSTHYLDKEIDAGDSTHPVPTKEEMDAGTPSPYGVWGALGTINGGDKATF